MFEEITQFVVEYVRLAPVSLVYLIIFTIAYVENVIPPIPGDVLVAFAGYLAADGLVRFDIMLIGTTIASIVGFMSMYALGSKWGDGINVHKESHWLFRYISFNYTDRAKRWMNRWGAGVILANRFLAGTRSVISLMAGISHIPIHTAIWASAVSAFLWNSLLLWAGWLIRENWEVIGRYLNTYGSLVLVGLALFAIYKLRQLYARKLVDK
jgi:membrane protein DedA with SNARE-associated domain